jgi:coiled-coil domain-containing protein 61
METSSRTFDTTIHGTDYQITAHFDAKLLNLTVEERKTGFIWSGEFGEHYIEDITRKTGNYKKFPTFINMLISGLENSTRSVIVDILTYQDLEALKSRKGRRNLSAST